ncbi:MAG: sulfatase-like hydrolase/transferase, partial [Akkermansiaceae bacterium]
MKALIFSLLCISASLQAADRPNIILIMTDDQGWGDTGYNGHPHLKTPHLDQMQAEGVTFTRFYSGAAMCSPTRGSCYTGRNPYRFGITFAMKGMLEPTEIPITSILKKQGYTTGHFGKWHLGTLSKEKGDQKRWGTFAKQPERYYCPPWLRDVDVSFVTESKVPTWDPLVDPGPIKKQNTSDANPGKEYGNDYFTGPGTTITENTKGDDSRVIMDRALPFIQNATLRENVLFGLPFCAGRYARAVRAACLGPDLAQLPAGDATEIGERGVTLSGGQKARVSLARCVYAFRADPPPLPLLGKLPHVIGHYLEQLV